jgi:hypothetical protein
MSVYGWAKARPAADTRAGSGRVAPVLRCAALLGAVACGFGAASAARLGPGAYKPSYEPNLPEEQLNV